MVFLCVYIHIVPVALYLGVDLLGCMWYKSLWLLYVMPNTLWSRCVDWHSSWGLECPRCCTPSPVWILHFAFLATVCHVTVAPLFCVCTVVCLCGTLLSSFVKSLFKQSLFLNQWLFIIFLGISGWVLCHQHFLTAWLSFLFFFFKLFSKALKRAVLD